jgi:predicted O-methyltransferase YrrM
MAYRVPLTEGACRFDKETASFLTAPGAGYSPMSVNPEQWTSVDQYLEEQLLPRDETLEAAVEASVAAGLPSIQVTPCQGKLLQILALSLGARSILEIGTLGGYSTIWLARALPPGGRLITLELNPQYAAVARANLARADVLGRVELRLGPALETLPQLVAEAQGPFDLVFIDADKPNTAEYFRWALKLSRRGSLIIADNVVRSGGLIDGASPDPNVQGMRQFTRLLGREPRVQATVIQTVGGKGYDGFAVALVVTAA